MPTTHNRKYLNGKLELDANVSLDDIKKYFRQHNAGPFFSMFDTGLNGCIFDLIRVDPYRRYVRIFEFKSSRRDFASDKKWQKYLKYCHTFTFVCPRQVIQKSDVPSGIGLMWIYKSKHEHIASEWIQKPKRRDVPTGTLTDIAFALVHRVVTFGRKVE